MKKISLSETRMVKELLELSRATAEEFDVDDEFIDRLSRDESGKRVIKASIPALLSGLGGIKGLLAGYAMGGIPIGELLTLAPSALYTLIGSGAVGARMLKDQILRGTGIDPDAGLPWMLNDEVMNDPSWREPKGSKHMKDVPEYAKIPNISLTPDYDMARERAENKLRDQVRFPSEYATSGDSAARLREKYMRPRNIKSPLTSDPLNDITTRRIEERTAGSKRGKFVKSQLFQSRDMGNLINVPDSPFLGMAIPGSPEAAAAMFAGSDIYNPVGLDSPRYLPDGGQGFASPGAMRWQAGGTPLETALNKSKAFAAQEFANPRLRAGIEAAYNGVMMKLRGGVIDPRTASTVLARLKDSLVASGISEQVVDQIHQEAIANLMTGRGGFDRRRIGDPTGLPAYDEGYAEDIFDSGRKSLFEDIEGRSGDRMNEIAKSSPFSGGSLTGSQPGAGEDPMMKGKLTAR